MNTPLENIEKQLNDQFMELDSIPPLQRYNAAVILTNKAVFDMKEYLRNNPFSSMDDEIHFFKQIRPKILATKLQTTIQYNLAIHEPIGTNDTLLHYFDDTLKGFQSLFKLNSFYYQYYKNQFSDLDHLYFVRKANHSAIPLPELTDPEDVYSTPISDLFARFIAYEQAHYYIIKRLSSLSSGGDSLPITDHDSDLRWTGDVVNIVELAYGVWLTGQMNHGNASLNQIVRWLEISLKVNIGIAQRKFTEISSRKRISITKFIDQMRSAILNKADDSNK